MTGKDNDETGIIIEALAIHEGSVEGVVKGAPEPISVARSEGPEPERQRVEDLLIRWRLRDLVVLDRMTVIVEGPHMSCFDLRNVEIAAPGDLDPPVKAPEGVKAIVRVRAGETAVFDVDVLGAVNESLASLVDRLQGAPLARLMPLLESRTGLPYAVCANAVRLAEAHGFLEKSFLPGIWQPTRKAAPYMPEAIVPPWDWEDFLDPDPDEKDAG